LDSRRRVVAELLPTMSAPATARALLERFLIEWDRPNLAEDASLIITELVGNGVVHAGSQTSQLRVELVGEADGTLQMAV